MTLHAGLRLLLDCRLGRRWFGSPSASHSVGFALGGENVGVMAEAVEQGRGELLIAEYLDPLAEGEVGGHQGGAALIAVGEQVEEQLAAGAVEGNEPQFVDDQQRRPLVALVQPGEGSLVPGFQEAADQVGGTDEGDAIATACCLKAQGDGQVYFPRGLLYLPGCFQIDCPRVPQFPVAIASHP